MLCADSGGKKKAEAQAEDAELDALMEELNQPAKPAAAAETGKKKKKGKGAKGGHSVGGTHPMAKAPKVVLSQGQGCKRWYLAKVIRTQLVRRG
eukprot:1151494-Pelagomonas_calceolata.AAC.2